MASINRLKRELLFKVVFYGPGLGGKTTTLQHVHAATKPENRGNMLSLATDTDRTLYFDYLPVKLLKIGDVHIKLHSADPSLAGRLHAGVSDLIGSLSHAGYEAEAWTAGQGQRQHREPQERRSRRPDGDVLGGESFGGFLQQSEF